MDELSIKAILLLAGIPVVIFSIYFLNGRKRMITLKKRESPQFHEYFDSGNFTHPYNEFNGVDSNKCE